MSAEDYDFDDQHIVDYLKDNPDFFERNPEMLTQLTSDDISAGNVTSLAGKQAGVWRDRHQELEDTLNLIVSRARDNENRSICLHHLALQLSAKGDWADSAEVAHTATAILRDAFPSNTVNIWVCGQDDIQLKDQRVAGTVAAVFESGKPFCGPLNEMLKIGLFGDFAKRVASAVVMPLLYDDDGRQQQWGILVFGSSDASSFKPGKGTMFLVQAAEIIAATMHRVAG